MGDAVLLIGSALWLGVLTSISPCPLASNIVAVSYISKQFSQSRRLFFSGLLYAIGRALAYLILGIVVVEGLLSMPMVSYFLQKYMNQALGPILILAGVFILELVPLPGLGFNGGSRLQEKLLKSGNIGTFLLGSLFALSFCPVSAALFFGSLIPLAIQSKSGVVLPFIYGIGTALPVVIFSIILGRGTSVLGSTFKRITELDLWFRRITGTVFIGVGIYMSLIFIFKVL